MIFSPHRNIEMLEKIEKEFEEFRKNFIEKLEKDLEVGVGNE